MSNSSLTPMACPACGGKLVPGTGVTTTREVLVFANGRSSKMTVSASDDSKVFWHCEHCQTIVKDETAAAAAPEKKPAGFSLTVNHRGETLMAAGDVDGLSAVIGDNNRVKNSKPGGFNIVVGNGNDIS